MLSYIIFYLLGFTYGSASSCKIECGTPECYEM